MLWNSATCDQTGAFIEAEFHVIQHALALLLRRLSTDSAWTAAHVDEDWQMARWGRDEVALERRTLRRREFDAAAVVLTDASGV